MKDDTSTPTPEGSSPNEFERGMPGTQARDDAEAAIQQLRQRGGIFVEAVRATRMPMALTDPNLSGNSIVFANEAFLKLSGYGMDEVLGQQPHFMNGPGTDPKDAARFAEALRSEQDDIIETVQYRKDGSRFVSTVLVSAFKDEQGQVVNHFMSWLDVTRRVEAEDEIAELKHFEAVLRDSDTRHRLLINSWAQAVWETGPDGVVVKDSPSWRAYTGQTVDEWLGHGWLDAIHPDDRDYAERQWRAAIGTHSFVNAEFRLRARDGSWRWTNVRAAPVLDENGAVEKWAGMNIDIDARKRAEDGLRASEERFRTLFESMDEGYLLSEVIFDEANKPVDILFLDANPAAVRLAGRDFTGQRMREIDPDYEQYWYETYGRVALTGEPVRADHYAEPHGRWFDFNLSRVGPPENRRVASIFQDITERRKSEEALRGSEERYRLLFDANDAGFCTFEMIFDDGGEPVDFRYIAVNDGFTKQTGRRPARGATMRDTFPEAEHMWLDLYAEVSRTGEAKRFVDHVDGLDRWYDVYVFPIDLDNHRILGALFRDVTDQRHAEAALRESEERYRSLFESMDEAYAVVDVLKDEKGKWADFRFVEVNPAFMEHTNMPYPVGKTATELLGTPNPRWTELYAQALDTGEPLRVEESEGALGLTFDLNIFTLDAAKNRVAVLFTNITERKQAEAALRESEEKYASLFAASPAPILILRPDAPHFTIADFNDAYLAATMRTREDLLGRAMFDAFPDNPDDPAASGVSNLRASLERALVSGQFELMDVQKYDIVRPDGTFEERWWKPANSPVLDSNGNVVAIIHHVADVSAEHRAVEGLRASERHANILLAELQHRVRNTLSVVRSIARRTAENSTSAEDMLAHFQGRLDAFSRVQAALTRSPNATIDLQALIEDEMIAHAAREGQQVSINGPNVALEPKAAERLSLAIHELTTNAVKHGALTNHNGHIQINWQTTRNGAGDELFLSWKESGIDVEQRATRWDGFGMELLLRSLPYDLQAETKVELQENGLLFELRLPLRGEMVQAPGTIGHA